MSTEFTPPIADPSSDNTVQALYPPDLLGSTKPVEEADCGAPIHLVDLPPMGAMVRVDAYQGQARNDTVVLNLNGQPNIASGYTETESSTTLIPLPKRLLLPDVVNRLTYTVIRGSQNMGTSTPLEILYNAIRPGNEDTEPGPPHDHSRLELLLPDAIKNGVGPDFVSATVCVRYPYCRAYDVIRLNCNGYDVYHTVTPGQAPEKGSDTPVTVCFTLTRADLEAAKDHPQFVISFTVTDQPGNGPDTDSPWSAGHVVDIDLAGNRLPAPILLERMEDFPGDDSTLIERDKLAGGPLFVIIVTADNRFLPGDIIEALYAAKIPGQPEDVVVPVSGVVEADPFGQKKPCILQVPNDKVIAESAVTMVYTLKRGGTVIASSATAKAQVIGESTITLNPPVPVANPVDALAHPDGLLVQVGYPASLSGDEGQLILLTPSSQSFAFPLLPLDPDHQANFTLDAAFLGAWHGKVPQFVWALIRGGKEIVRSGPLVLKVNRIADGDPRLTVPNIVQAKGTSVVDLNDFPDDATFSLASWRLIQEKQLISVTLLSTGIEPLPLLQQHSVSDTEAVTGLSRAVSRSWLSDLSDNAKITIRVEVLFGVDSVGSVVFKESEYTIRQVLFRATEGFENSSPLYFTPGVQYSLPSGIVLQSLGGTVYLNNPPVPPHTALLGRVTLGMLGGVRFTFPAGASSVTFMIDSHQKEEDGAVTYYGANNTIIGYRALPYTGNYQYTYVSFPAPFGHKIMSFEVRNTNDLFLDNITIG